MTTRVTIFALLFLTIFIASSFALRKPTFRPAWLENRASSKSDSTPINPYQVYWFNQTIDHFNFQVHGTFSQRYLLSDKFWGTKNLSAECPGPILFYTGNEGGVTEFWENSGFITDVLASEFGALVIFAEHRYYGESYPFGKIDSYKLENIGYLNVEQALADYASLLRYIKYDSQYSQNAMHCPVISFGGSYGGMLTAWFRMKYPTIIAGGLASSAPVGWFIGAGVEDLQYVYAKIVTQDYEAISPTCSNNIHLAFNTMIENMNNQTFLSNLRSIFRLCNDIQNVDEFYSFLSFVEGAFDTMAQYDYPYPTTFAGDLPGWPVNQACNIIIPTDASNENALLTSIFNAISIYYNTSGTAGSCYSISEGEDPYAGSWGYQTCTEMVLPYASNGVTDMFFPDPFNFTSFSEECYARWKVTPRPLWAVLQWGGLDVKASSNIFFSNGKLDPYSGGGVLVTEGPSLPALYITDSAHHLDIRGPNEADPHSIRVARDTEKAYIQTWINEWMEFNA